ncbi:MAG: ABC transporter ATP-binding protein [Clostridia bacterium]|nr:ABC transporter ATP-binding protein [Clostridia bacterium]
MKTLFKLLKLLKKYYIHLVIALTGMFVMSSAQLCAPAIIRKLIQMVQDKDENIQAVAFRLGMILLAVYLLQAAGQFCKSYFAHYAAWNFIDEFRQKLYGHIQNMSMGFFHDKQTGQLMSRITNDTTNLEPLIAHALPDLIVNGILLIGSAVILFSINVRLALYTMMTVPFTVLCVYIYSKKVRPMFKKSHEKMGELNAAVQDNLSGVKEIQIFNKYEAAADKVKKSSNEHKKFIMGSLVRGAICNPIILFTNNISMVIVIIAGGFLASKGQIDAADIVAFSLYVSYFYQPILSFAQISEQINTALTAAERSFEILEEESPVKDGTEKLDSENVKGLIEYKDVCFSYKEGRIVLNNVSIRVDAGKTLALVGPTGIGKTTFINLLTRFYDVDSGEILIDGENIKKYTLSSLHDSMSLVLQDVFLFHGTIEENIAFGVPGATKEQVIEAAKAANAHEFIMETENGYDTLVGERGMRLSGGQKQRISIARAVLRNCPILILDEATASVDTKTEKLIQQSLNELRKDRTTILIAHRLSTVRNADIIAVVGEDGISEAGTHEELMEKNGVYASLVRADN